MPPPHWQLSACGDQAMTSDCDGFRVQGVWRELYQGRRLWLCVCVAVCACVCVCVWLCMSVWLCGNSTAMVGSGALPWGLLL